MGYYVDVNVYADFDNCSKVYNYIKSNKEEFDKLICDYTVKFGATGLKISGLSAHAFSDLLASISTLIDGFIYAVYEPEVQPGMRYSRMYSKGELVADYEIDLDDDDVDAFMSSCDLKPTTN